MKSLFLFAFLALQLAFADDSFISLVDYEEEYNPTAILAFWRTLDTTQLTSLDSRGIYEAFEANQFYAANVAPQNTTKDMRWVSSSSDLPLDQTDESLRNLLAVAGSALIEDMEAHEKKLTLDRVLNSFSGELSYQDYIDGMDQLSAAGYNRRRQTGFLTKTWCRFTKTQGNGFTMQAVKQCKFSPGDMSGWMKGAELDFDLACDNTGRACGGSADVTEVTDRCGSIEVAADCESSAFWEEIPEDEDGCDHMSDSDIRGCGYWQACVWDGADSSISTFPNHRSKLRCRSRDAEYAAPGWFVKTQSRCSDLTDAVGCVRVPTAVDAADCGDAFGTDSDSPLKYYCYCINC